MSFAGTPLGQGRRLDHNTFLGKPPSNSTRPTSPHRIPPISYAYGAPALGSRSPPKPNSSSSSRERNPQLDQDNNSDESALVRYSRLREQKQQKNNSVLNPEKWSVKDTSVNIASALHQAAEQDMNPNAAWASASRPATTVPRSTSVEYESQSQTTTARRLAPPPNRLAPPSRTKATKPLSKNLSTRTIPDSEEENSQNQSQSFENGRGKSPFSVILDTAHKTYEKATFYAKQRPEENSYDYSAEERDYQSNLSRKNFAAHKRNKISMDNKAYKPSVQSEDEEEDDDDLSDDGRKKRRKKKKDSIGGLSLPVISADKRRKKRKGKSSGGAAGGEASESGEEEEEERVEERPPSRPASRAGSRAGSVPRMFPDDSLDVDQRLTHIPEEQDEEAEPPFQSPETSHDYSGDLSAEGSLSQTAEGIGARLGKLVHSLSVLIMSTISMIFHIFGKVLGTIFDIILIRPFKFLAGFDPSQVKSYLTLAIVIVLVGYLTQQPYITDTITHWTRGGKVSYTPPGVPAADIAELNKRLQSIEAALSGLVYEQEQSKVKTENGERSRLELISRLGNLEGSVKKDISGKVRDLEKMLGEGQSRSENEEKRVIGEVRREMEALRGVVDVLQQRPVPAPAGNEPVAGTDEEARTKLKALEDRVGSVEGGVKDAIEISKNAAKTDNSAAWWNKLISGKKMTIKASDGSDVISIIANLVEHAVISLSNKDILSRADFALHSAGARIVPRLTSPTFEMRLPSKTWKVLGFLGGGGGYGIGRPPVTALHHETHVGYCWSFAGTEGNLGVNLVTPTLIDAISIDHVAREVALDVRSAPKQMEVWGMVDGADNLEKAKQVGEDRERRRKEAAERGEDVPSDIEFGVPSWMSNREGGLFLKIAEFSYDIQDDKTVQTFPVAEDITQAGLDFGTVVLRIKSNWGQDTFTCLYRLRVHGKMLPPQLPGQEEQD